MNVEESLMDDLLKLASADGLELEDRSECVKESGDWSESESGDWSECADGLEAGIDESEGEKSSNADESEQSQSADEMEAEGCSPSDGMDGSETSIDESEREKSSNADESEQLQSTDELEAEGSPSDGMDGSEDEDSEDMDGSEPSMEEMMVDFQSEQDAMKSSMNKWYDGVEVIDLTGIDDGNLPVPQITTARKKEDYVWAGEADANDVVEIEKMLLRGSGVYGSIDCKLEIRPSLLQNAGRGVFIKDNCTIHHGECITEYSGKYIRSAKRRSVGEQLRIMHIGSVMILGAVQLTEGDGFGSLINSSVNGRTLSFCRLVSYCGRIFVMAHVVKKQYPLRGRIELYITVGQAWWNMFNDLNRK